MAAGSTVFVVGERDELGADQLLSRHQLDPMCVLDQGRGHEDRDLILLELTVAADVLALEVGVDRHLNAAPSTDRRNEINRRHPALLSNERHCFRSHVKLHTKTNLTVSLPIPSRRYITMRS